MNLDDYLKQIGIASDLIDIAERQNAGFKAMMDEAMFQFNGEEQQVVIALKSKLDRVMAKAKKGDVSYLKDLEEVKQEFKKYTDGRNSNG